MVEEVHIRVLNKAEYLENPLEIGLDHEWKAKSKFFDQRMKMQGVYILHISTPSRTVYVGKTRGSGMDFQTRLYRHATKAASQNGRVYLELKRISNETKKPLYVSLLTTDQLRSLFSGIKLEDAAIIDVYEQLLIHFLKPEVNSNEA